MIKLNRNFPIYECNIPSKNKLAKFRPFLVSDEKNLLVIKEENNKKLVFENILSLLENCFYDVNINEITLQDMEFMFCSLRAKSVGEYIPMSFECPKTNEKVKSVLDISKLNVINGVRQKEMTLDANNKIVLKEPTIKKILLVDGNFDTEHFIKASIDKIIIDDNFYELNDITQEEFNSILTQLTIGEYDQIKEFVNNLPKITSVVEYQTKDGEQRKTKVEGILNFFTHAYRT